MRQKRAKAYRKLMALYSTSFGFRQPYQILVDSEMCKSATDLKLGLVKQLGIVLQGEIKPMITQCCIHELYLQGKLQQTAVDLAKTFERRKCNHREPISGDECLVSVVGDANKHRYVIVTQSKPLRVILRNIPAVPIIHLNRSVMVLEPPSDTTIKAKECIEKKALHPTASDMALVGSSTSTETSRKKKKGPKGPNPLSVKKKKNVGSTPELSAKSKRKAREKEFENDVTPAEDGMHTAKVGEKRKRGETSESLEGGEKNEEREDVQMHSGQNGVGKKRKRRRKMAAGSNHDP